MAAADAAPEAVDSVVAAPVRPVDETLDAIHNLKQRRDVLA